MVFKKEKQMQQITININPSIYNLGVKAKVGTKLNLAFLTLTLRPCH
jgi:hypothetical protein